MKIQKPRSLYPKPGKLVDGLKLLKVGPDDVFVLRQGPRQEPKVASALAYDIAAVTRKYVIILAEGDELTNISRADLAKVILGDTNE